MLKATGWSGIGLKLMNEAHVLGSGVGSAAPLTDIKKY
jgi:hypothetical protein